MLQLKILFVCIGNTCRSPMAESIMKHLAKESDLNWDIDSAALRPWNVGRKPDQRCMKVLAEHGLTSDHIGRVITDADFCKYDYILAMDNGNIRELKALAGKCDKKRRSKIEMLGSYIGRAEDTTIQDPYFSTGMGGFRCAFTQIFDSCQNFIQEHMYVH